MDCVAPLRRGGDAIHQCPLDAVALCFLLTCALPMTSSHSEGLLLLTSDGSLTNRVLRPSANKEKEYLVSTSPSPTDADLKALAAGVMITTVPQRDRNSARKSRRVPKSYPTLPCQVTRSAAGEEGIRYRDGGDGGDGGRKERGNGNGNGNGNVKDEFNEWFKMVLHEGRNRQIRKMCAARSLSVTALHRIRFGGVTLQGLEGPGVLKELTAAELDTLQTSAQ